VEILKQPQYTPFSVEKQVAIIYLGTQGLLREVAVKNVKAFEDHLMIELESKHSDVLADFKKGNLSDVNVKKLTDVAKSIASQYK
jgi:F-type H+-transporting ATPase subunit alpha